MLSIWPRFDSIEMVWTTLLAVVVALLCVVGSLVYYIIRKQSYWKDRGIPYLKPAFLLGIFKGIGTTVHFTPVLKEMYRTGKGKHPFSGAYMMIAPAAVINDPELVKNIFVKDFHYFHDRGVYYNKKHDPLTAHLFNLEGQEWRFMRNKLSPTFTSGKMKMMFPTIVAVGRQFCEFLQQTVTNGEGGSEVDLLDLMARFTTDVIGTCAFGIECNCVKDPEAEFRVMGRKINEKPPGGLSAVLIMVAPNLAKKLGVRFLPRDVSEYFLRVVRETVDQRLKHGIKRNDFMDLLIGMLDEARPNGSGNGEDMLNFKELAAQAFLFFAAGFETSATLLSWALYELALSEEIQSRARQCVKEAVDRHGGEMTYDAIMEMKYLDQILNETMRKYPSIAMLLRIASKDYPVPGTDSVIEANTPVLVPIYAMHHDPQYFPDPDRFDPDRFTPEAMADRHPFAWLPFGEGPRMCIGIRFGMMQSRIGLALLLAGYRVQPCPRTTIPMEFLITSLILYPKDGMWLKVTKV
ncbi:probable cytochrome P450 6a23 [Anopheles darlingi]|uniref:probable cytochrome P450 6a23 n=1 Tax=Anopheles darlingi TaxID=43151 RepID=UPI0021001871|nr:probable cytochrome P450 6a23 [Anopheles darlingi]